MIEQKKCYILSITSNYQCELKESTLKLLYRVDSGINKPWFAQLGNGCHGYLKSCVYTDPSLEDLEVWLAFLGSRLGVSMTETYLILDENMKKIGSFSVNIEENGSEFFSADDIKNQWLVKKRPIPEWAVGVHEIHQNALKKEPMPDYIFSIIEEPEKLRKMLEFIYGVVSKDNSYNIRKRFTDMVLFDCMIWQKDRNMSGFGLVRNTDGLIDMAGLFDNATITMPGLDESWNGFCNILCRRQKLVQCTAELFPREALDFASRLERFLLQEVDIYQNLQNIFVPEEYCRRMVERMDEWEDLLYIVRSVVQKS